MGRKESSWDDKAQEAAYLYAQYNMSQGAIGAELGCSQSQVSRLLKDAEKKGWLQTEVRFIGEGIPQQRMEEIQRLLEPRELVDALRNLASMSGVSLTVKVFDSGSDIKDPQEYPERLRSFGRAAAGRIRELLRHARTVGVTWGNTLSQMIEGLASSSSHKQEPVIQFVPVCAELVRLEDTGIEYSSSRLAHRLSEVINHKQVEQLSLTGIPAFLPRYHGRERKDVELLHKYLIDNSPSYKKIFTDSELRLVERVDTVLTSVGSFGDLYPSRVKPELSMAWGADANKVEALILGDVGGVLIPKPNLSIQDRKLVEEMNHMWTGLKMSHLERLARITSANKNRSTASGSGNVVVAVGARKAAVIHEAVRLGLVNELIIDRALAGELEQTFQRTKQTQINTSP